MDGQPPTPPQPAAESPASEARPAKAAGTSRLARFKNWYGAHKMWTIPATIIPLLIIILGLIPTSRYYIAGLFIKKNFVVQVNDYVSTSPVSGASVAAGSAHAQTDGSGRASLRLPVGPHVFTVSKKYYQTNQVKLTVPILKEKRVPIVQLTATGRQVKVVIKNIVTGQSLAGVSIVAGDVNGQTDNSGTALLVLPATQNTVNATFTLAGYNDLSGTIKISNNSVQENDFNLTPAGKIYFFSNRTGKLNVMKSDLDGANAQVVLAGTGTEQAESSAISQSPDGKYVALLLKRSNADAQPQLYMLSVADDKLLTIDTGNTVFLLQGWVGDKLIYTAQRNDIPPYTPGANKLKSYDAASGKTFTLDQSSGVGDANASANEYFQTVIIAKNSITYSKDWTTSASNADTAALIASKQNTLNSVAADGTGGKTVASYPAADPVQYVQHAVAAVYIWDQASSGDKFYDYPVGGSAQPVSLTSDQFYAASTRSVIPSADGSRVVWAENRDGKNTVLVGDSSGNGQATVATSFTPYGWFTNQYILLSSQNGSTLYIAGASGNQATSPLKITDFQQTSFMP